MSRRREIIQVADVAIIGVDALLSTVPADRGWTCSLPFLRTISWLPVFIIASGIQYNCHQYLSSLPKYTLPTHPLFRNVICPHYTAECAIYLSLAFLSAPKNAMVNSTVSAAFVFVAVNLSITAAKTKKWSEEKFGKEKVASRWILVPFLY